MVCPAEAGILKKDPRKPRGGLIKKVILHERSERSERSEVKGIKNRHKKIMPAHIWMGVRVSVCLSVCVSVCLSVCPD